MDLQTPELHDERLLRAMQRFYSRARVVTVAVEQLTLFDDVPDNCFIAWEARKTGAHPLNQRSSVGVLGFRSASTLLGGALFDVRLPTAAVGMYIGIKEWQGTRRSYVRIDNIFQANTTWPFGINDLPARPHFGREKFQILPTNRFQITWGSKFFSVMLNGAGVSTLKLPNTNLTAAPVLSELFVWVFARPSPREQDATVRPLPSLMQLDADIPCSICQVSSRVARRGCAVCPRCCTWVCRRHVQEEPLRPCRRCPAMLGDYLGGSEPVGDIVRPYIDAGSFWLSVQTEAAGDCGKFDLVTMVFCEGILLCCRKFRTLWHSFQTPAKEHV